MVRSLRVTTEASQDQDWLKTNLASIGSMLQGHRDLEVVAELIMEELAPLLGAQHGTFFLTEDWSGERRLRLIAGYGLRADKDAPIQYRIGQSLIGQVAKSKRPIVVDAVPHGYIKISSGLGEASPSNLAIMPLMFEDQVLGVMELASFTKFTPIQIAFLEQLAETLGISVNAIIANSRTDALLEESQRLTAELQARSSSSRRARRSCSSPTRTWRTRPRCSPRRSRTSRPRTRRSSGPGKRSRSGPGSSPSPRSTSRSSSRTCRMSCARR